MKLYTLVSIALLTLIAATPASAVYKCKDANGRISFQQAACTGAGEMLTVQPASGPAQPVQTTEADRLNAQSARLAKENRLSTLNNLTISAAQGEIYQAQNRCQAEFTKVRNRKSMADNSLAGATWEQSLSAEMQAIAAQCDTEQRRLQANLDRLLAEKQDLERELAKP